MEDRYVFDVDWFNQLASLNVRMKLTFYPSDNSVELFNTRTNKLFLKRTPYPQLNKAELVIGGTVTVFSRQLTIIDYSDQFTKSIFQVENQRTYGMIKPDAIHKMGEIISKIEQAGFQIARLKMRHLTLSQTQEFYREHQGKPFYENLTKFIASGPVVGMELVGKDMIQKWRQFIGPTNCQVARVQNPDSIRALYGQEGVRNAAHGSDSIESAQRELNFFFEQIPINTDFLQNPVSCVVIKNHIIRENKLGLVLRNLQEKLMNNSLEIVGAEIFKLEKAIAQEFLEVYKDVVPEYGALVNELSNGPILVLAISGESLVVQSLRKICGPHDPQIARNLRNHSLRAQFGRDKVQNGIHCTDLEEDGQLECEYFFNILQK